MAVDQAFIAGAAIKLGVTSTLPRAWSKVFIACGLAPKPLSIN